MLRVSELYLIFIDYGSMSTFFELPFIGVHIFGVRVREFSTKTPLFSLSASGFQYTSMTAQIWTAKKLKEKGKNRFSWKSNLEGLSIYLFYLSIHLIHAYILTDDWLSCIDPSLC